MQQDVRQDEEVDQGRDLQELANNKEEKRLIMALEIEGESVRHSKIKIGTFRFPFVYISNKGKLYRH